MFVNVLFEVRFWHYSQQHSHQTLKIRGGKEMKKFVVLTLFGLLIMAFSGMAYAQKLEFKASGTIDFDTVWNRKCPLLFRSGSCCPWDSQRYFPDMGYPCIQQL